MIIAVGGVALDLASDGALLLSRLMTEIGNRLPKLSELYDKTASLQDRTVGTGILTLQLARQYACGGFVGRASGRKFDARKALPYAPYDRLVFQTVMSGVFQRGKPQKSWRLDGLVQSGPK
jgi:NADH:ubiquinone oxidoreductase subunit D